MFISEPPKENPQFPSQTEGSHPPEVLPFRGVSRNRDARNVALNELHRIKTIHQGKRLKFPLAPKINIQLRWPEMVRRLRKGSPKLTRCDFIVSKKALRLQASDRKSHYMLLDFRESSPQPAASEGNTGKLETSENHPLNSTSSFAVQDKVRTTRGGFSANVPGTRNYA